jgi:hypothetical protein
MRIRFINVNIIQYTLRLTIRIGYGCEYVRITGVMEQLEYAYDISTLDSTNTVLSVCLFIFLSITTGEQNKAWLINMVNE